MRKNVILVTCAIIEKDGNLLIAQRAEGKHLAGYWEFPGGKIEESETPTQCLIREIKEELNVEIELLEELPAFPFQYPEKTITLLPFRCKIIGGQLTLNEHTAIKWISVNDLLKTQLAPADIPIAEFLKQKGF